MLKMKYMTLSLAARMSSGLIGKVFKKLSLPIYVVHCTTLFDWAFY
jgi:hypothetical protein